MRYTSTPSRDNALLDQGTVGVVDVVRYPRLASTETAQVVRPYTNASGKYVAIKQQPRSTFRAHGLTLRLKEPGGGDGLGDLEGAISS